METRTLPKNDEKITIALITTYPEMSKALSVMSSDMNIKVIDIYAAFEEAAEIAKRIENEVDVILTRGGTGHFIKEAVSIPVISVPISPFALAVSISKLPKHIKRVAFSNYQRSILGVEAIEALFGKRIRQYHFTDKNELKALALQAKEDGCETLIGGAEGVAYAKALGLEGVEIVADEEAIYQALTEAIEIIRVKREEKKRAARLKAAIDSLKEGICITDEEGNVSVFNPAAASIFKISGRNVIGCKINDISIGGNAVSAYQQREEKLDQLEKIHNVLVNANHMPIYLDGDFIGVVSTFQDITRIQQLEGQIRQQLNKKGFKAKYHFEDILTCNQDMVALKEIAKLYAQTDSAVLIEGESGTGKELFAHSIHNASSRALGPFVTVNCAAIPEQLLESELFGYAPGAFTGARREGRAGLFELAQNGTIFLDEIGEMPLYLQSRLLRVLQEKEIMRVGDNKIVAINCRIISATNKNLLELVTKGEFRQDLYYRLSLFTLEIPPLRDRREDIPLLCEKFWDAIEVPDGERAYLEEEMKHMSKYRWPGNIRELSNTCARIALICTASPDAQVKRYLRTAANSVFNGELDIVLLSVKASMTLKEAMDSAEYQYVSAILERNGNNRSETAKQLGIGRTTLWRRDKYIADAEETTEKN